MTTRNDAASGGTSTTPLTGDNNNVTCDMCGAEAVERVERSDYCAVHAADWKGYVIGRKFMALMDVGRAVRVAMEEDIPAATLLEGVHLALKGDRDTKFGPEPWFHEDTVHGMLEPRRMQ